MGESDWMGMEKLVKGFVGDLEGVLKWSWEGRFSGALSQFTVDSQDRILEGLKPHFESIYDMANLGEADPRVYELCQGFGGLRSGQLLLATDPDQDVLLLGAWWPWGNDQTISIRIIPASQNLEGPDKIEFMKQFKSWFGI